MAIRHKLKYVLNACATATSLSAALVTKDGEIRPVEQHEKLPVLWIA